MSIEWLWNTLFGRRRRRAEDRRREDIWTLATSLTLARASAASAIFTVAIVQKSGTLMLVALGISMVLDFFDGFVARMQKCETILGAQLDGAADRLAAIFVVVGSILLRSDPQTAIAGALVWFQFGVVDQFLTNQFLRFGLWSLDHTYVVHKGAWYLNWHPAAKFASNLPIVFLAIGAWGSWLALVLAAILIPVHLCAYPGLRAKARELIPEQNLAVAERDPAIRAPIPKQDSAIPEVPFPANSDREPQRVPAPDCEPQFVPA